jgi:hypothetical protein
MSDEVVSKLLPIAGPLLGAIVGGFISVLSTWALERQKWRRDRREKLATLERDALSEALEWIEPMRNAEMSASLLVMAAIQGDFDHEKFLKDFPYLVGDLGKKDLSGGLRAVLPDDAYRRGHEIIRNLEDLRVLGVKYGQEARVKGKVMTGFKECSAKLGIIGKQITELETDLRKAFYKTFE